MADHGHYFDLLAREVARSRADKPESREEIYERARRAQSLQLQGSDPMFSVSEVDHERNTLEESIRRIEALVLDQPMIIETWQMLLLPRQAELPEGRQEADRPTRWQKLLASSMDMRNAIVACILDRDFVDIATAKAALLARWRRCQKWARRMLGAE
jgi:hypothetical protein